MPGEKPAKSIETLKADVATIDSKIGLIAQKLKTIENNQEVLGQTIVMQNEKLKALEAGGGGTAQGGPKASPEDSAGIKADVEDLRKQVQELRYVLNSVNPLEFVTVDQVKEMLKDRQAPKA
ncbi:MAG: hypothetical protein V1787_01010 [Candidatus Micrarchaeota archaeon]